MNSLSAAGDPAPERRAGPRYRPNPDACCRLNAPDEGESQPAELQNVSAAGINVLVSRRYEVGTSLVVQLTSNGGRWSRVMVVRVARIAEQAGGRYALGCVFHRPLDGHELLSLVL